MKAEDIYAKYPKLFARVGLPSSKSCMAFGMQINEGWYPLIIELSDILSKEYPDVEYRQIKEKFGTLRVYLSNYPDDKIHDLLYEFDKKSSTICESCGKAGNTKSVDGWYVTICPNCIKKSS